MGLGSGWLICCWGVVWLPRNRGVRLVRKNVRIPKSLVDEVDWIVRRDGLYVNRQQFIESAIREKVEKVRVYGGGGLESTVKVPLKGLDDDFLVRIREHVLALALVGLVKGDLSVQDRKGEFVGRVRAYVRRRAEVEGRRFTERQVEDLTDGLLECCEEILEG